MSKGDSLKAGLTTAFKGIATAGTAVVAGATAMVAGLNNLETETREYRENQAKATTAMEQAGFTAEDTAQTYTDFYKILGDQDTATEATQLLSKLASTQEDLTDWTTIATGVVGEFGDSLPIESLIEAANETAKVGEITGTLADALNWAGVSEDEFNSKLATMTTEQERNAYITETLTGLYADSAAAYEANNEQILKANELQAKQDEILAKVGDTVLVVKNAILEEFLPTLATMSDNAISAINEIDQAYQEKGIQGVVEKVKQMGIQSLDSLEEKLPEFTQKGLDIIASLIVGLVENAPYVLQTINDILIAIAKGIADWIADGNMLELGKDIVIGLWNGIASMAGWIGEKITGFVDGIKNIFTGTNGFDTHSPSKWSQDVFANVVKGGEAGLEDEKTSLLDKAADFVSDIKMSFEGVEIASTIDENLSFANQSLMEDEQEVTPLTAEMVLETLLAGFAGVATTIFDAIPKEQIVEINGREVVKATWDDFVDQTEATGKRLWTYSELKSLISSLMPKTEGV